MPVNYQLQISPPPTLGAASCPAVAVPHHLFQSQAHFKQIGMKDYAVSGEAMLSFEVKVKWLGTRET